MAQIQRLGGSSAGAEAVTEAIMLEYLTWLADRFTTDCGVVFDDLEATLVLHHREFTRELPNLIGARGRLLVARTGSEVVGVGALKPIDSTAAEIKRMYVRPQARGQGIGQAILDRLLDDARTIGYRVARLETAPFMTEAQQLYRSMGFRDTPAFDNPEAGLSGLEGLMFFMALPLAGARQPR